MPIEIPASRKDLVQRQKTDVKIELPGSNPFLPNSLIGALITAFAGRNYDFYLFLEKVVPQLFPNTATGEFLEIWGTVVKIFRLPATQSTGYITFRGSIPVVVPIGTQVQSTSGLTFTTLTAANVISTPYNITSLTRVGSEVTAVTMGDHELAAGVSVTIAGANETEYNGTFTVRSVTNNEFTYQITGTPTSPATGTITATSIIGTAQIESDGYGAENNLESGDSLTLLTPIPGVIDPAFVQHEGLSGGTDLESDESLRERIIFAWQNPSPAFNPPRIEQQAKMVQGVTRVFIKTITPAVGQVTIYFLRDNDPITPIPNPTQVAEVKAKILEINYATTNPDDVIVLAPTPVTVNFTFSLITPNTAQMQEAITANLKQFFREQVDVGVNITETAYKCAIYNTVDPVTGNRLQNFTLTSPIGDIAIGSNQVGILGTVTYP